MRLFAKNFVLVVVTFLATNCVETSISFPDEHYLDSLATWKIKRKNAVLQDWYPLVGLEWFHDQPINNFGSGESNELIMSSVMPTNSGIYITSADHLTLKMNDGLEVLMEGKLISEYSLPLDSIKPVFYKNLEWTIIRRNKNLAMRIWDRDSEFLNSFEGLTYFEPDPNWIVEASFESYPAGKTFPIDNVLGYSVETTILGKLSFLKDDIEHSIDVLDGGNETWFLIFGDQTNGEETYGAGRYIYVPIQEPGKKVIIDFNKCYNPPCVFTEFATCPIPPAQNQLQVRIEAGEKSYGSPIF